MKRNNLLMAAGVAIGLAALTTAALASQDRYSLKVPGGLSFSEFKGYQSWQVISLSHTVTSSRRFSATLR